MLRSYDYIEQFTVLIDSRAIDMLTIRLSSYDSTCPDSKDGFQARTTLNVAINPCQWHRVTPAQHRQIGVCIGRQSANLAGHAEDLGGA